MIGYIDRTPEEERQAMKNNFSLKTFICRTFFGYVCDYCCKGYFLKRNYDKCHAKEREEYWKTIRRCQGGGSTAIPGINNTTVSSRSDYNRPYPGGPGSPAGLTKGAQYGGHYIGGTPYANGPGSPAGFVPNDGFISPENLGSELPSTDKIDPIN